ncbi:MAG TPA: hypothetical protein VI386_03455 [Candidatus Sulfotelmatobacter sp.]
MKLRRHFRRVWVVAIAVVLAPLALVFTYVLLKYDPPALSPQEITERVDRLNEGAAVQVPHFSLDHGKTRAKHIELFQKVERGEVLSDEDGVQYRLVYQELLREHQRYLRTFDGNLTVLLNVGMIQPNNVHGKGIEGSHDHHDESARSNFRDMRDEIQRMSSAQGPAASLVRTRNAICAYKDLTDILLHLATAPQTKSVPYDQRESQPADNMDALFDKVLREFKLAQFEAVNSVNYKEHIIRALDSYDLLVEAVQKIVYARLSPLERTFSGAWAGWQSLGPPVGGFQPTRISRKGPPFTGN